MKSKLFQLILVHIFYISIISTKVFPLYNNKNRNYIEGSISVKNVLYLKLINNNDEYEWDNNNFLLRYSNRTNDNTFKLTLSYYSQLDLQDQYDLLKDEFQSESVFYDEELDVLYFHIEERKILLVKVSMNNKNDVDVILTCLNETFELVISREEYEKIKWLFETLSKKGLEN